MDPAVLIELVQSFVVCLVKVIQVLVIISKLLLVKIPKACSSEGFVTHVSDLLVINNMLVRVDVLRILNSYYTLVLHTQIHLSGVLPRLSL